MINPTFLRREATFWLCHDATDRRSMPRAELPAGARRGGGGRASEALEEHRGDVREHFTVVSWRHSSVQPSWVGALFVGDGRPEEHKQARDGRGGVNVAASAAGRSEVLLPTTDHLPTSGPHLALPELVQPLLALVGRCAGSALRRQAPATRGVAAMTGRNPASLRGLPQPRSSRRADAAH